MGKKKRTIGITLGDLNGIGPEVVLRALSDPAITKQIIPVVYGTRWTLNFYKEYCSTVAIDCHPACYPERLCSHAINLVDCAVAPFTIAPGIPSRSSGEAARIFLQRGVEDVKRCVIDGLVTAPVDKNTLYDKIFPYRGHTEYLTHAFEVRDSMMMMVGNRVRIGLVTEHIAVKNVADMITAKRLNTKIKLFEQSLKHDFHISKPTIAVLGLNPHAGDEGLLGEEEHTVIRPVIQHFQRIGSLVSGPFAADGFFAAGHAEHYDGVLAMYHDQGLIPFKLMAFDDGVNYTAGLPVVRTSPDHGVAYDIAGKHCAKYNSMKQAIYTAVQIVTNRDGYG